MGDRFEEAIPVLERIFPGESEMARRMRAFDWTASAVGDPLLWPENLRGAVRLCLTSSVPILIWWGPQLSVLYNDAYLPLLGEHALMQPGREAWREIWASIEPMLDSVFTTGAATWSDDFELFFDRKLRREEVFVSFSYSPILGANGHTVDGVFCACQEHTESVVGARRLETLRKLGVRSTEAPTIAAACQEAASVLGENQRDSPFAALYVVANGEARLATAELPGQHRLPACVSSAADDPTSVWPLGQVLRSKRAADFLELVARDIRIPAGEWPELIDRAIVLPILGAPEELAGLLVLGVSPRQPLDDAYRTFFALVATHIGAALSNAQAYDAELKRADAFESLEREQRLRTAAEDSEWRIRTELVTELAAMRRLHELASRLQENAELQPALEQVLEASIELLGAAFGNIQLHVPEESALRIVAQRGFKPSFLDYFDRVRACTGSCGKALAMRRRVVVEDVLADPSFEPHLPVIREAGFRAVQSTPLVGRNGELLGMLSTHFRRPHRPSERDLRLLDLYARLAGELIERLQSEEKLRRTEERFRRYFDLGLIGGALTAPDKGYLQVNDELCRILGYDREELVAKNWTELTHPEDLAQDVAQHERVLAGEIEGYTLDERWLRKDGAVIDSIMAARAVRRSDGSVDYLVRLVQDITARKRAEESLQRLQAELAHVARVTTMSEMASSVAHELNQPLAAIIANAGACTRWLAKKPSNLQEANQAIADIVRDAERASEVIARVRRFVQRRALQLAALDLNAVAREAAALAEPDIRRHRVSLSIAETPGLPHALGDRVQLQQVILNLLKNAVEAMDPITDRSRTLELTVCADDAHAVCVAVRDSGTGIDSSQRERIFDAFHTTKPSGLGMGLAISRSIVEAHGGRLWATANEYHGETFRFTLPIASDGELSGRS
jgi:PAS domain S-box-containing protein